MAARSCSASARRRTRRPRSGSRRSASASRRARTPGDAHAGCLAGRASRRGRSGWHEQAVLGMRRDDPASNRTGSRRRLPRRPRRETRLELIQRIGNAYGLVLILVLTTFVVTSTLPPEGWFGRVVASVVTG